MARQSTFFHKCHRCIYRGQPANWEPEAAPLAMINVHAAEEPAHAEVKEVPLRPAPKPAAKPAPKPAAAKAKKAPKPPAAPTPVAATSPVG